MSTSFESSDSAAPRSMAATPEATGSALPGTAVPDPQHPVEDVPKPKCLDPSWIKEGFPDTKFYKDYPPDAWGQEAAPNARVWKIYRDELTGADAAMLKSWNSTVDVLLIFAGLFSAVSTAFIIESYKSLQPDYTEYIANVLYVAATNNRGINGAFPSPSVGSMGPPDSFVHPSATQRWTNGLWFTSLVMSLTVALLCILVKQWLDQYHARTTRSSSSLRAWARRHQIYSRGLEIWGIPTLISLLPLLLHVSLFLFLAGLVLFLRPLDSVIANTLLTFLALTGLFYLLALLIPAWCIDCPSYTPMLAQLQSLVTVSLGCLIYVLPFSPVFNSRGAARLHRITYRVLVALRLSGLPSLLSRRTQRFARETSVIDNQQFTLDGQALTTLILLTNDPDVIYASIEAIGAISAESTLDSIVRHVPADFVQQFTFQEFLNTGATSSAFAVMTDARRVRAMWSLAMARKAMGSSYAFRAENQMVDRDLYPFLGLDGMMIQLMAVGDSAAYHLYVDTTYRDRYMALVSTLRDRLSAHVFNLLNLEESGQMWPLLRQQPIPALDRATCLLFLRVIQEKHIDLGEHRLPCLLLTFCAGVFWQAEPHEQTLALKFLCCEDLGWLTDATSSEVWSASDEPSENGDAMILDTLDYIFVMLATEEDYRANDDATLMRPIVHHLGLVLQSISYSPTKQERWARLTGLAEFAGLPEFERYVSREGLKGYVELLSRVEAPSRKDTELFRQYWTCVATLLKISCKFVPLSQTSRWEGLTLVWKVEENWRDLKSMLPLLDRTYDTILLALLEVPRAIGSWTYLRTPDGQGVGLFAEAISCLLCFRQRNGPTETGLIERLFTGPYLTIQFRQMMYFGGMEQERRLQRMFRLARHCARLSLDDMLRICGELENPSEGEVALAEEALALVGQIRRGLLLGGELRGECDPSCDCILQPAEPTTRTTRWRDRIFPRISAAPESSA